MHLQLHTHKNIPTWKQATWLFVQTKKSAVTCWHQERRWGIPWQLLFRYDSESLDGPTEITIIICCTLVYMYIYIYTYAFYFYRMCIYIYLYTHCTVCPAYVDIATLQCLHMFEQIYIYVYIYIYVLIYDYISIFMYMNRYAAAASVHPPLNNSQNHRLFLFW